MKIKSIILNRLNNVLFALKNLQIVNFFATPIVFNLTIRNRIKNYLIFSACSMLVLSFVLWAYGVFNIKFIAIAGIGLLIFMPFIVYMFLPIERKISQVVKKQPKDQAVKYWLFTNKFLNVILIVVSYLWFVVLLLISALAIIYTV